MDSKSIVELTHELSSTPNLRVFLSKNKDHFFHVKRFHELLTELFAKSGLTKAVLAKRSATSDVYLYQIFSGIRTPSRDRALCLCFGLSATLEATQELLQRSGFAPLYVKNRRDAIIMHALAHGNTLPEVEDKLFSEKEETLC